MFLVMLAGGVFFYTATFRPALQVFAARNWQKTPCVVVSAKVEQRSSGHRSRTFYRIEMIYRYSYAGREYTSDCYSFTYFNGGARTAEIVRQYSPGQAAACFVNQANPAEAVFDPRLQRELAFGLGGLFMGVVTGVGLWRSRLSSPGKARMDSGLADDGPVPFKPLRTRLWRLLLALAFAVVYNGHLVGFVYLVFLLNAQDQLSPLVLGFLGLLALFGLSLVGLIVHAALALSNPRIVLTGAYGAVLREGELQFSWIVTGPVERLQKLSIVLYGGPDASRQFGNREIAGPPVFARIPVIETKHRESMRSGTARVVVPEDVRRSFEASNHPAQWLLKVHGEISSWPDVKDAYSIAVLPT